MNGFYLLTGGPGSGKSTLLAALAAAGHACAPEVARPLIREQLASGGDLTPWGDVRGFAVACRERMLAQLAALEGRGPCFFDRGLPDLDGYLAHRGFAAAPEADRGAARRYRRLAFIAPPWREIFVNDPERPQTWTEAGQLDRHLRAAYRDRGFTLCVLPRAPVAERVAFVEATLAQAETFSPWPN